MDYTQSDGYVIDGNGRRQYADTNEPDGVEGTLIDAEDSNQVRNELVHLIAQAGITPSNDDLTQVWQAVRKMVLAGEAESTIGFTPVEQGGVDGLTTDKINIGNSTSGLAVYIAGKLVGVFAMRDWVNGQCVGNNGGYNGGIVKATIDGASHTPSFLDGGGNWHVVAERADLNGYVQNQNAGIPTGLTATSLCIKPDDGKPYLAYDNNTQIGALAWFSDVISEANTRYAADQALQNAVDGKEDAGTCVTTATYNTDFGTSDSRVINLPYGHKLQSFVVVVPANGTNSHRITYPEAFSGASVPTFNGNDNSQSRSVSLANNTTPDETGFDISVSVHGNSTAGSTDAVTLTVNVTGPR